MGDKNWWCRECGWFPHRDDGWVGPFPTSYVKHPCKEEPLIKIGIMRTGKWYKYLWPKWINHISYKARNEEYLEENNHSPPAGK